MPQGETHHGTFAGNPHPRLSGDPALAKARLGAAQARAYDDRA